MRKPSPKAQASLDRVVARFQSGDLSPLFSVATLKRDPPLPFDGWSYRNRVLAYAQSDQTDLRGYRQWQAVGRQVRKGSTAAFIWAPRHVPVKRNAEIDTDGKVAYQVAGFSPISVFSAKDTDGDEPLPQPFLPTLEPPPLMDLATTLGLDVKYMPNIPGALGNTDGKRIHLGTADPHVFFHELAHCLHRRVDPDDFVASDKPRKEAVADFTAAVLMEVYGLRDQSGQTWNYISWFHKDPLKAIYAALGIVENILGLLDELVEQPNPSRKEKAA